MMFKAELLNQGTLTDSESEVLCRLCEGLPSKRIAQVLNKSVKTVIAQESQVYLKLGVRKQAVNIRMTALLIALDAGMVSVRKVLCHG